jgi:hypothetical protein
MTQCPQRAEEWTNQCTTYVHTLEYYTALSRIGLLTQAATPMDLEDMLPRERSQAQKDEHCVIPVI